jgi:hypothetical protein
MQSETQLECYIGVLNYCPDSVPRFEYKDSERNSNFVLGFLTEIYKFEGISKPWDRTTEVGNIPAGETGL